MSVLVDPRNRHTMLRDLKGVVAFIGVIWLVFLADRLLPLEQLGLVPRTLHGLVGIVAMPFLHGDLSHLLGNTLPLTVTLLLLAGSRASSGIIVLLITLLSGALLWVFGRTALHIGASGLVFGLIGFHLFAGVFEKRIQSVVISLVVGALYTTTLVRGVLPLQSGVSWDGHLCGAVAGIAVAALVAATMRRDEPA